MSEVIAWWRAIVSLLSRSRGACSSSLDMMDPRRCGKIVAWSCRRGREGAPAGRRSTASARRVRHRLRDARLWLARLCPAGCRVDRRWSGVLGLGALCRVDQPAAVAVLAEAELDRRDEGTD